jgi:ankyrin repeat protein
MALAAEWKNRHLEGVIDKTVVSECLKQVASHSHSVTLGRTLLELGADINYQRLSTSQTPLQHATKKSSRKAAQFVKFLLLSGADPGITDRKSSIADEKGAQNISKWLGMTWEELVEFAKAKREAKLNGMSCDLYEEEDDMAFYGQDST